MSDDTEQFASDSAYDGIKEYDNPLPLWWLITFFGTIIFGFHYWIHYEFGGGTTQKADLKAEMAQIQALRPSSEGPKDDEKELTKLSSNPAMIAKGKSIYDSKCSACHGVELQGQIGPNLTDEYWIHGRGGLVEIASVVRGGVLDKGMPNWESQLNDEEIRAVTVFVASRKGSNPPNAKPPQGEKVVGI